MSVFTWDQGLSRPASSSCPTTGGALHTRRSHLTECINQMVSESQLPHKIVNLLFTSTNLNNNLMILWGIWLSETIWLIHSVRWEQGTGRIHVWRAQMIPRPMNPEPCTKGCQPGRPSFGVSSAKRRRLVCGSQVLSHRMYYLDGFRNSLSHKIINLLFTITCQNDKLTILWGSWLSRSIQSIHSVRWGLCLGHSNWKLLVLCDLPRGNIRQWSTLSLSMLTSLILSRFSSLVLSLFTLLIP